MQGLGHVADIIRVWGWLVCIIKASFQKASQPMKHFFRRCGRDISEAHFAHFGAKRCRACRRCWVLALQAIPSKTAVLSGGLLFCPFCFCGGWLACCAALAFFPLFFGGARATPPTKRCNLRCFVAFAFPGWLAGCSFWAALSGASGARARPHVSLLGWGPAGAQKAGIPGIIWGNMRYLTSHIVAQDTSLKQKNMT